MVPLRVALVVVAVASACTRSPAPAHDSGTDDAGGSGGGGADAGSSTGGGGGGGSRPDAGSCGGFGGGSQASITSATTSYDFGAATVGSTSATAVVNLTIRQTTFTPSVVGPDHDAFAVEVQGCFPTTVSHLEYVCPVSVTFSPARPGAAGATLAFNGTANAGWCLPVTGTSVDAGLLELSSATLTFDAGTGAPTATVPLTITNHASVASGAVASRLTGAEAAFFEIVQDACDGGSLPASGSCQLRVRFVPGTDAGRHAASLRVDSASAGTAVAQLQGIAATPGMLALSSGDHDFGAAAVDAGGAVFDFVVTNVSGAVADTVSTVNVSGAYAADFAIAADQCSTVALQPAQSCTVTVRFEPHSAGVKVAALTVASASSSLYATLTGSAQ